MSEVRAPVCSWFITTGVNMVFENSFFWAGGRAGRQRTYLGHSQLLITGLTTVLASGVTSKYTYGCFNKDSWGDYEYEPSKRPVWVAVEQLKLK